MSDKVKKIQFQKNKNTKSYFDIVKLQDILSLNPIDHNQYENHKLTFFALFFATKGEGKHGINFIDYPYKQGTVLAIGANSIHKFYESNANGYFLVFKDDFVLQYLSEKNADKIFRLFNEQLASPKQQLNDQDFKIVKKHINAIKEEFLKIKDDYSHEVIRSLLHIIITHLIRVKSSENTILSETKYLNQFLEFQVLVERFSEQHKTVSAYADQMCITPRTLNNITHNIVHKSAKAVISDILISKIKRYLINSDLNITQIAFKTGFKDSSHLSKFLNKHTGCSPKKFRELF